MTTKFHIKFGSTDLPPPHPPFPPILELILKKTVFFSVFLTWLKRCEGTLVSRRPASASSSHPDRKLRWHIGRGEGGVVVGGGDGGVVGDDCGDGDVVVGGGGGDVGT